MDWTQARNENYRNKSVRLPPDIVEKAALNPVLSHFMLVSAGHRDGKHNTEHYVERYSAREYIIIYCTNGRGWMLAGNTKWMINPGDIVFCFKDSLQCYGADVEEPWEIYWACFAGEDVPYMLELLKATEETPVFSIKNKPRILSLFSDILDILERGYAIYHLVHASCCLQQLLSTLSLTSIYTEQQSTNESVIENTVSRMVENIDGILKLEQLSSAVGMSANYFAKYFQRKMDYTPMDYFIRLKMQKACTLLNTTPLSVKEISYQLGYQDVYYFSRIFKKKIGTCPKQYRKLMEV